MAYGIQVKREVFRLRVGQVIKRGGGQKGVESVSRLHGWVLCNLVSTTHNGTSFQYHPLKFGAFRRNMINANALGIGEIKVRTGARAQSSNTVAICTLLLPINIQSLSIYIFIAIHLTIKATPSFIVVLLGFGFISS